MLKYVKNSKYGNPVGQNWQPCWSQVLENGLIGFAAPKNYTLDTKMTKIGAIGKKLEKPPTHLAAILKIDR